MPIQKKDKDVICYIDKKLWIDKIIQQKDKNWKIIVYPFRIQKDWQLQPKYKKIEKITFDLSNKVPEKWFSSTERWWYWLTKVMNPLVYFLENILPQIKEIYIWKEIISAIDEHTLKIDIKDYFRFFRESQKYSSMEKNSKNTFINNYLAETIGGQFMIKKVNYTPGQITKILSTIQNIKLSSEDQDSIMAVLTWSTITNKTLLLKSKEAIDEKYIEDVITEYEVLLQQKTDTKTLEKKWQSFFKIHNRIFSQILALPVVFFEDEAYVWWKWLNNQWWKVIDFLYQNKLTSNIVLIEVKTHKTPILGKTAVRWDDVFSYTSDFSWAINQLLDQKHNLLREYATLASKSKEPFEVFDPSCFLIIWNIADLNNEQKKCFSLTRSSHNKITIITYDELLEKIKIIAWLFQKK